MLSAMDHNITPLERAFQLARSGECHTIEDIRRRMKTEGYPTTQVDGRALSNQLRSLIQVAIGTPTPKGPKGEKRPADVIGNAVKIAKIATGEIEEDKDENGKDKAAQSMGRRGGKARAEKMTAARRVEIAKKAASKRWRKT